MDIQYPEVKRESTHVDATTIWPVKNPEWFGTVPDHGILWVVKYVYGLDLFPLIEELETETVDIQAQIAYNKDVNICYTGGCESAAIMAKPVRFWAVD